MARSGYGGVRAQVELAFERWGRFAFRHHRTVILVMLLVSVGLISQVPKLRADNSTDSFLHPSDPIRLDYNAFRLQFGRDSLINFSIETPEVFDPDTLLRLKEFHADIERSVPHIEDLTSLLNARDTRGDGDELIVEDLFEEWPESAEQLAELRARALANPIYRNTLLSADATVTNLSVKLYAENRLADDFDELAGFEDEEPGAPAEFEYLPQEEEKAAVLAAREVVQRWDQPGFRIHMAGGPVMTERLNATMESDVARFVGLALLTIAVFLYLLLRRISAVFMSLLVVVLAMLSTVGVMAGSGTPMSVGTQILPSLLLGVGVCDAVHILAIYYRRLEEGDGAEDAIAFTLAHSGLAVVMTSLTTAGGLLSFLAAELAPVAQLGIFAPVGVMFALIYTLALLPALLAAIPTRPPAPHRADNDRLDRALQAMGAFAAGRPWSVVAATVVILVLSFLGATKLRFSHDPLIWFDEEEPFRVATTFMNDRLEGLNPVEIVIESPVENALHDPDQLRKIAAVQSYAESATLGVLRVVKTLSIVDVVQEIHQALNENRPEFHTLPDDRQLIAQELLLFENSGSDDLEDFTDSEFRKARITLFLPWTDAYGYAPYLDGLTADIREIVGPDASVVATGLMAVLARTFRAVTGSMTRSYAIALLIITPLMILLIGDLRRGLLSMIPNLMPVIMTLGFMGWANLSIDASTMMVGAVVIGLAVDDTIHYMHNFRRYFAESGDAQEAIRLTLATTGRALLVSSLVLTAGFLTFMSASLKNLFYFGMLSGGAITVAFLANVLLSSALMVLATRRGW